MKILITSATTYNLNGITKFIVAFFKNINKKDLTFDFVSINDIPPHIKKDLEGKNSKFYKIECRRRNPLKYYRTLKKICSDGNYDLIHAHGNSYTLILELLAARKAGIRRRISHIHSVGTKFKILNYFLKRKFVNTATDFLCCSKEVGEVYYSKLNYIVIKNAFDLSKFKFNENQRNKYRQLYRISDDIVWGHIGTFQEVKNHEFLVKTFYQYSNIIPSSKLVLVGVGPTLNKIKNLVNDLGIEEKVMFLGERTDVSSLINSFDLFVFPSLFEGLGIVLIESEVNGLPLVVSNRIPNSAKLTDNILTLNLSKTDVEWAKSISLMKLNRNNKNFDLIKNSGYDIVQESIKLRNLYMNILENGENL